MFSMIRVLLLTNVALLASASVFPRAPGTQFITGPCNVDADCAAGCCAFNTGKCAGPVVALDRDGGCGHGNAVPNANAAIALGQFPGAVDAFFQKHPEARNGGGGGASPPAAATPPPPATGGALPPNVGGPPFDPAGVKNVGNGKGTQFIGGQCLSAADCASGCCAGPSGICSGVGAQTQAGKTGCGFVAGGTAAPPPPAAVPPPPPPAAGGALPPNVGGPPFDPAGVKNVGNGKGGQFIGGQCLSAADCASGCCAGPSGICSGVGAQTQAGKTGCGFVAGGAAAPPPPATVPPPPPAAAAPTGSQFITGPCKADADCASGCCGFNTGKCAGAVIALERDGGCGFGGQRNANAAKALGQFPGAVAAFAAKFPGAA